MVLRKKSKRLIYKNKFGMCLIMGVLEKGSPEEISFFNRGGDVVCFKLMGETERAYWYEEFDPTLVGPEPTTTKVESEDAPVV